MIIEVYYAGSRENAHVKLRIQVDIPGAVLSVLKIQYGKKLVLREDANEEPVNVFDTEWYKVRKSVMTPAQVTGSIAGRKGKRLSSSSWRFGTWSALTAA